MHISKSTKIGTRVATQSMAVLPEACTETNFSSVRIFAKSGTIHSVNLRYLSFHLVLVSRSEIKQCCMNKTQRSGWVKASHPTKVSPSDGLLLV